MVNWVRNEDQLGHLGIFATASSKSCQQIGSIMRIKVLTDIFPSVRLRIFTVPIVRIVQYHRCRARNRAFEAGNRVEDWGVHNVPCDQAADVLSYIVCAFKNKKS